MPPQSMLGRYNVIRLLGRGTMGEVLEVSDPETQDHFALKRIPADAGSSPAKMKAIRTNFSLVSKLTHPHIAATRFLELDTGSGDVYIIMDLVRGCDLGYWLVEERERHGGPDAPLPIAIVLGIAEQIACALDYAHSQPISYAENGKAKSFGILHRDLKPENIMVEEGRQYRPGIPFLKLVDFGIAAQIQTNVNSMTQHQTGVNAVMGTPIYMAPEQWQGRRLSRAIDQWALAVIIYEMAEGRPPFSGVSPADLRDRICNEPPMLAEALSAKQWAALGKAFNPDRTKRYSSATALVKALANAEESTRNTIELVEPIWPDEAETRSVDTVVNNDDTAANSQSKARDRTGQQTLIDTFPNRNYRTTKVNKSLPKVTDPKKRLSHLSKVAFISIVMLMAVIGLLLIYQENSSSNTERPSFKLLLVEVENRSIKAGETVSVQINARDPNNLTNAMSYSLIDGDSGAKIDSETGLFKWETKLETPPREYKFKVRVSPTDSQVPSIETVFSVSVASPTDGSNGTEFDNSQRNSDYDQLFNSDAMNDENTSLDDQFTVPGPPSINLAVESSEGAFEDLFSESESRTPVKGNIIINSIGMKLINVPAGRFSMGAFSTDSMSGEEEFPEHRVTITKSYYLGETEVTQEQWRSIMHTTPWRGNINVREGLQYPVTFVNYEDATEFCRRLNEKEQYRLGEYSLPTEAEWEYACNGGEAGHFRYCFGDSSSNLVQYAWYSENAWDQNERYAHKVKQKKPNSLGLYDMHGNVREWCDGYFDTYTSESAIDPQGAGFGDRRVSRGGSWFEGAPGCRKTSRHATSSRRSDSFGFRVKLKPFS